MLLHHCSHPPSDKWREDTAGMTLYDAIHLATRAHAGQYRADGTDYIEHPLTVLRLLWKFNLDLPLEAYGAAVLHDVLEDTTVTYENILLAVGPETAAVVRVLTKDEDYYALPRSLRERVYLERIVSANSVYPYALLIKMADRLHNISTAHLLPTVRRHRLLRETETIYLPFLQAYCHEAAPAMRASYRSCAVSLERTLCFMQSYCSSNHLRPALRINSPESPPHTSPC